MDKERVNPETLKLAGGRKSSGSKKTTGLKANQKLFVRHYLSNFNEKKSAEQCGLSVYQARSLMVNPLVKQAINEGINKKFIESGIDENAVIKQLKNIAFEQNPKQEGINFSDQIQALKLLGIHMGMFTERQEEKSIQPPAITIVVDTDKPEKSEITIDNQVSSNTLPGGMVQ